MTRLAAPPLRIRPFYKTRRPGKEILLIKEEATLSQGDNSAVGTVSVSQEWAPMRLVWEFAGVCKKQFRFGDVQIRSKSFVATGQVFSISINRVAGFVMGSIEIGSNHELDRITFHLLDYPDFSSKDDFHEEFTVGSQITGSRWSEIILEADEWRIKLQPIKDMHDLRRESRNNQASILSGVGEIRRADETQFTIQQVTQLLEGLRIFLSFSFAGWTPPLFVVGSSAEAEKSCQLWSTFDASPRGYLTGWVDEFHGQYLAVAFPGFMKLWGNEKWREPLELAVSWLIEASKQSSGIEGAIAFGQIPLEMLAWLVFVDERTLVQTKKFDRLSAPSKLQMLLVHCGIPIEIPDSLGTLKFLAAELQKQNDKTASGPQIATKVRNTIIHPNEKNRKVLTEWEKKHSVKVGDIRCETHQLFKWYITLVLLRLIGYSGNYVNRLIPRNFGEVELVPWSHPNDAKVK